MRVPLVLVGVLAASSGCKSTDCGPGTIEKAGTCEPADVTTSSAMCGPFTELQGDKCVPMFPPTVCDPGSTTADTDPTTGVTTCIGTGTGGGCSGAFACPAPSAGKQTVCGQIYDLETNTPFADTGATGAQCAAGATSGPCALGIQAYDAVAFATDPSTATPLTVGSVYIDDCGRYRVTDITPPAGPFVGLGIDDANPADMGPAGITNAVGIALSKEPDTAIKGFEAWIVKKSTTDMWEASGGPPLSGGISVGIFSPHQGDPPDGDGCIGSSCADLATGVMFTKSGATIPADDYYFKAADTNHQMIDPTATATGANGTGLLINASVSDSLVYSGTGGLSDSTNCQWKTHAAASLPGVVSIQIYRPVPIIGHTCSL